jgi:hypothetical protein
MFVDFSQRLRRISDMGSSANDYTCIRFPAKARDCQVICGWPATRVAARKENRPSSLAEKMPAFLLGRDGARRVGMLYTLRLVMRASEAAGAATSEIDQKDHSRLREQRK